MTGPRRVPSPRPGPTPRESILAAAVELFAEHGIHGTSLRRLADRLGLHNSTLLYYFPDKASLASSVTEAVAQRQLEILRPLAADSEPRLSAFAAVIESWAAHLAGAPAEARVLLDAVAGPSARAGASLERSALAELEAVLRAWLERAGREGVARVPDPDAATSWVLGLVLVPAARRAEGSAGPADPSAAARFARAGLDPRR